MTYVGSLSKWMMKKGLGEITARKNLLRATKVQEVMENHKRLHPEGTQCIKKKKAK